MKNESYYQDLKDLCDLIRNRIENIEKHSNSTTWALAEIACLEIRVAELKALIWANHR